MTANSRLDMLRHSQLDMRAPVWPEAMDETKRSTVQKRDEEYVEEVRELMQLLRRKATAKHRHRHRHRHRHSPLAPCRPHRQCLSRNNPHERETFCASRIAEYLRKARIG
jgi:hypothetical protein